MSGNIHHLRSNDVLTFLPQALPCASIPASSSFRPKEPSPRSSHVRVLPGSRTDSRHSHRREHFSKVSTSIYLLLSYHQPNFSLLSELATKLRADDQFSSQADELAKDAAALVEWMRHAEPSDQRYAIRTAYTDALQTVYIVMAIVSLIATISTIWVQQYSLDQQQATDQPLASSNQEEQIDDKDWEAQREAEDDRRLDWAEEQDRRRLVALQQGPEGRRGSSRYSDREGLPNDSEEDLYEQSRMEMPYRDAKPQSMARLERQTVTWI